MDVSVRELRNHTARVVSAVEGGEVVVLTSHGRPIADIVPHRTRSERRSSELVLADLSAISAMASGLSVESDLTDFELDSTTDELAT